MPYDVGDTLMIPKRHLFFLGDDIEVGQVFKATDLGDIEDNDGNAITFVSYHLVVDEVLEESCRCRVIE
ncbi:hypothetical protein A8U91_01364 [Halomonas elongata]|uniref:Uncharacterized protein n=1 Tax=Halomonas elongata TaxID=2746 RepID=A0A1B8P408_HALEL|nr:hypothetical protein [Halomonas elongata]OBX37016.1 hypothetical protein A8U91_01364 [Halomonas elongata]